VPVPIPVPEPSASPHPGAGPQCQSPSRCRWPRSCLLQHPANQSQPSFYRQRRRVQRSRRKTRDGERNSPPERCSPRKAACRGRGQRGYPLHPARPVPPSLFGRASVTKMEKSALLCRNISRPSPSESGLPAITREKTTDVMLSPFLPPKVPVRGGSRTPRAPSSLLMESPPVWHEDMWVLGPHRGWDAAA